MSLQEQPSNTTTQCKEYIHWTQEQHRQHYHNGGKGPDQGLQIIENELMKDDLEKQCENIENYTMIFNDYHRLMTNLQEQSFNTVNQVLIKSSEDSPLLVQRKKFTRWTDDEHRLFLDGLEKYGKGNWKEISRYIVTKSKSQVSSHAQKYFLRKNAQKKRRSIHDTTLEDIDRKVSSRIYQQNRVLPTPNCAMQPQNMQQAQYMS
uniref:Myb-like protein J n=1 Tax=Cajanus cajan TaxID=3821 RepID=A0A151SZJ6_CAJCA|nr:Myb-like protein J [Cajanus cajan]